MFHCPLRVNIQFYIDTVLEIDAIYMSVDQYLRRIVKRRENDHITIVKHNVIIDSKTHFKRFIGETYCIARSLSPIFGFRINLFNVIYLFIIYA